MLINIVDVDSNCLDCRHAIDHLCVGGAHRYLALHLPVLLAEPEAQ